MKKKIIFTTLMTLALSGCSTNSDDLEKVTVMLDYTPNTNHTGLYVADSLGYYEDQGLEVDILQPGDASVLPMVANGKVDFAISYEDSVASAVNEDMGITALASITTNSTVGPISRSDRGLSDPSKWEGATYCGWGTPIEEAHIKHIAELSGVDPSTMTITTSTQSFLADTNECDIFWGYEAWENIEASYDGIDYDYTPVVDYVDYYPTVIVSSNQLIEDDSDLVQSFMTATKAGYEYAAEDPEKATEIFMEANPEYDEEFIAESQNYISPLYINDAGEFGYIDSETWKQFTDFMLDSELVTSDKVEAINSAYTNKYLEEAK